MRPSIVPAVTPPSIITRRRVLRGVGVALALPLAESLVPTRVSAAGSPKPRRFLAICDNLGVMTEHLFPATAGRDYQETPYLAPLRAHRKDLTVVSGTSHPSVDGQHASDVCFLTAAPHPGSGSFRNTISLDQYIAEHVGGATRFPSLTLAVNSRKRSISWTASGVAVPPEDRAAEVYRQLFLQGSAAEVEAQIRRLDAGRSVLDTVAEQARRAQRDAGARDRARLDQYFTGVRELEARLKAAREWERRPKPRAPIALPVDPDDPAAYVRKVELMYDMIRVAFETDSTRVVALLLNSLDTPVVDGAGERNTEGYHGLSHHGKSESKRAQLRVLDEIQMKLLARLLGDLGRVDEGGESLLDRTVVLWGSNLGDANAHVTTNMPILLAGGGFRHGQHLAFDRVRNYPLPNLFVSVLHRLGIEAERFASSTGPMAGLELA